MRILLFFGLFLTFTLGSFSCSTTKDASNNQTDENTKSNTAQSDATAKDSLFASLERGFCFGKCPVYIFKIYQSGYATYEGKANVDMKGMFTSQVSKTQMKSLLDVAKQIEFTAMKDKYDGNITDIPAHTSTLLVDGKLKTVMRRYNYPQSILVLENQFEKLITSAKWKKIASPKQ